MFDWSELYENLMISISEQAYKRNKAEEIITSEMNPLTEHLIKILKWEDTYNNSKHIKDIKQKWLKRVKIAILSTKKPFKVDMMNRIILTEPMSKFKFYLSYLKEEYDITQGGELKPYRSDKEVEVVLEMVLTELSKRLLVFQKTGEDSVNLKDILEDLNIYVYGI